MASTASDNTVQVLIIEDDTRIAEINRRFIDKVEGFQAIGIATNRQQALEQLEILQPDLVLLDIYFPDMNGLEFMTTIQQDFPQTDVIMITAAKEVKAVREAIRKGAFDFLVKPLVFDRFQETMLNYLEFRRKLQNMNQDNQGMSQEDIDSLIRNPGKSGASKPSSYLPKNIDSHTLEKVSLVISQEHDGLTAEAVSQKIGASRSTARRYLEYLVSKGDVTSDLSYGVVGRPERVYRSVK